jgi:uncharacterized repeat protein (TIGR03803 family)
MKYAAMLAASAAAVSVVSGCASSPGTLPSNPTPASVRNGSRPARSTSSYRIIFSFDKSNGEEPYASLVDVSGTLYGTTRLGGTPHKHYRGTVFSLSTSGTEAVLHAFGGKPDGRYPIANLIEVNGALYGTSSQGGSYGHGTVFEITLSGTEKVLHSFGGGADGSGPLSGLIAVDSTLYGTTYDGGGNGCYNGNGCGTVFSISTSGKENVLYRFAGGTDGANPRAALLDVKGVLYGTTSNGGGSYCSSGTGCGTVFSVTTSGSENVIYRFESANGANPAASLIDLGATLYGTTTYGGSYSQCGYGEGCGTVFAVSLAGSERVVYNFTGSADGAYPDASLISVNGKLYGTTTNEGSTNCYCGTVFSVTKNGSETTLHAFEGDPNYDGEVPRGALTELSGTLYGTTTGGGMYRKGTVFALTP